VKVDNDQIEPTIAAANFSGDSIYEDEIPLHVHNPVMHNPVIVQDTKTYSPALSIYNDGWGDNFDEM
jgi:hypothetical protein